MKNLNRMVGALIGLACGLLGCGADEVAEGFAEVRSGLRVAARQKEWRDESVSIHKEMDPVAAPERTFPWIGEVLPGGAKVLCYGERMAPVKDNSGSWTCVCVKGFWLVDGECQWDWSGTAGKDPASAPEYRRFDVWEEDPQYGKHSVASPFDDAFRRSPEHALDLSDYKPEEGWRLIGRDTDLRPTAMPQFALYNKYSGTLRVCAYPHQQVENNFTYGKLIMEVHADEIEGKTPTRFWTNLGMEAALGLDYQGQDTNKSKLISVCNLLKVGWCCADFMVAYDPEFGKRTELRIKLEGYHHGDLSLEGSINLRQVTSMSSREPTTMERVQEGYLLYQKVSAFSDSVDSWRNKTMEKYKDKPQEMQSAAFGLLQGGVTVAGAVMPYMGAVAVGIGVLGAIFSSHKESNTPPMTFQGDIKLKGTLVERDAVSDPFAHTVLNSSEDPKELWMDRAVYRQPLGVFALTRTPVVVRETRDVREFLIDNDDNEATRFLYQFRVIDNLEYVVNPSSDMVVREVYGALVFADNPSLAEFTTAQRFNNNGEFIVEEPELIQEGSQLSVEPNPGKVGMRILRTPYIPYDRLKDTVIIQNGNHVVWCDDECGEDSVHDLSFTHETTVIGIKVLVLLEKKFDRTERSLAHLFSQLYRVNQVDIDYNWSLGKVTFYGDIPDWAYGENTSLKPRWDIALAKWKVGKDFRGDTLRRVNDYLNEYNRPGNTKRLACDSYAFEDPPITVYDIPICTAASYPLNPAQIGQGVVGNLTLTRTPGPNAGDDINDPATLQVYTGDEVKLRFVQHHCSKDPIQVRLDGQLVTTTSKPWDSSNLSQGISASVFANDPDCTFVHTVSQAVLSPGVHRFEVNATELDANGRPQRIKLIKSFNAQLVIAPNP